MQYYISFSLISFIRTVRNVHFVAALLFRLRLLLKITSILRIETCLAVQRTGKSPVIRKHTERFLRNIQNIDNKIFTAYIHTLTDQFSTYLQCKMQTEHIEDGAFKLFKCTFPEFNLQAPCVLCIGKCLSLLSRERFLYI